MTNVNAAPAFDSLVALRTFEGQPFSFRAFAFDPDNPDFVPQVRNPDGTLTPLEGSEASVAYSVDGLPPGAVFDPDTALFVWTPDFVSAGTYVVRFTATDDGNGTGLPLSASVEVPLTVLNANRPPVMPEIGAVSLAKGELVELPIAATDPDGNPLAYAAEGLPRFATLRAEADGSVTLVLAPGDHDRGDYVVSIRATDDGDGGGEKARLSDARAFVVSVESPAEPPVLTPIGDKIAVIGQPLSFVLQATDPDQDALTFAASGLPAGATLTDGVRYGTKVFTWTPTAADEGTRTITFSVEDDGNGGAGAIGRDEEAITLVVRASNEAPILLPIGDLVVAEGATLALQLRSLDADGDPVTFAAQNLPPGATLDARTGVLRWKPNLFQAGRYEGVSVTASDGAGSSSETFAITVTQTNQAPLLAGIPPLGVQERSLLSFTLVGTDLDGDALRYAALSPLPLGSFFDESNGRFEWIPGYDQAGEYLLRFEARDPAGATDVLDVPVVVDDLNRLPALTFTNHLALLGEPLAFTLEGTDPDAGAVLRFSAEGLPEGATLDPVTGAVRWTPGAGQAGDFLVNVGLTDGIATITRGLALRATNVPQLPTATIELTPGFPVVPGQNVVVSVLADAFSAIATRTLTIDGVPVALDSRGRAVYVPDAPGLVQLVATATDLDGFTRRVQRTLKVRDPADVAAPEVALDPSLSGRAVTAPLEVAATVSDDNLDYWRLELGRRGSETAEVLAGGTTLPGPVLATLDPERFENGFYVLRLVAADVAGRMSEVVADVELRTGAKAGGYAREDVDFVASLAGHELAFARRYDSQSLGTGSLGSGWRLAFRDVDLVIDVPVTGAEASGAFAPLVAGSRVVLSAPTGERVGFTFTPAEVREAGVTYFLPRWVPDAGVAWQLESTQQKLQRAAGRFYDLVTARPYNPSGATPDAAQYVLVAPDATRYEINAARGVTAIEYADGARLTVSDSGVLARTGEAILFAQDSAGRLSEVTAPDGRVIAFTYGHDGLLESARDLQAGVSRRYGYDGEGRLVTATRPGGGETIAYAGAVQVRALEADLGAALVHLSNVFDGELDPGETDAFAFAVRPSEIASTAGGAVLLAAVVESLEGTLAPAVPRIGGLDPILTTSDGTRALALFRIDAAGLKVLEVSARGAGDDGRYRLTLFVAGDVNRDARVDGTDAALLAAARGSLAGDARYLAGADFDLDGDVDAADSQLLFASLGYAPNMAPQVGTAALFTHVELEVSAPLDSVVTDIEGDPISFRILGTTNGTARVGGDGRSIAFLPAEGFAGTATIQLAADDGFTTSGIATVEITVSDAPLVDLDIITRMPAVGLGGSVELAFIGDFADQAGVVLPASYLNLAVTNTAAARIGTDGRLTGLAQGYGAVVATRGEITAATAFRSGGFATTGDRILNLAGLEFYPGAVTVAADGGLRQIVLTALEEDVAQAADGTQYFASDARIVEITPDGRIVGKAAGTAIVTAVHKMEEVQIPVKVEAPRPGPSVIGRDGGAVQGTGGAVVAVAPGALAEDAAVSIDVVQAGDLGVPLPTADLGFQFGGAFRLDTGGQQMVVPAQIAAPVSGLAAGQKVIFYKVHEFGRPDGTTVKGLLEVETGVVGDDGIARTSSPPAPGVTAEGDYAVIGVDESQVAEARARLFLATPFVVGATAALPLLMVSPLAGGIFIGAMAVGGLVAMSLPISTFLPLEVHSLDPIGRLTVTGLEVDTTQVRSFETRIVNAFDPDDLRPQITSLRVDYPAGASGVEPELVLTGTRFLFAEPSAPEVGGQQLGTVLDDVRVRFRATGAEDPLAEAIPVSITEVAGPGGEPLQELRAKVPRSVAIGSVVVEVVRKASLLVAGAGGIPTWDHTGSLRSAAAGIQGDGRYVLGALGGNDQVVFISALAGDGTSANELVARVDIGDPLKNDAPRAVAVTPDNARAYVTLRSTGMLAVVDTIMLQQLDAVPDDPANPASLGVQTIALPAGARPFWVAIDSKQNLAFVSEEVTGRVYVVDIDPASSTYHRYLTSIDLPGAKYGLRGIAMAGAYDQLVVTAPGTRQVFGSQNGDPYVPGRLFVIDVADARQRIADGMPFAVGAPIETGVGDEPYGISPTPRGDTLVFAAKMSDSQGVGVLQRQADGSWSVTKTVGMNLGVAFDAFDVNNASAVVVTEDMRYAFVMGYNRFIQGNRSHDPDIDRFTPAGSNVGIIRDPFDLHADMAGRKGLVAATRMTPISFGDNLALSPDGRYLYASYVSQGQVQVFDVPALIAEVENSFMLSPLQQGGQTTYLTDRFAINDLTEGQLAVNTAIDVKADFRLASFPGGFLYGFRNFDPERAPLAVGSLPRGLVAQQDFIRLISPGVVEAGGSAAQTTSTLPTFEWSLTGRDLPSTLFISTFGPGEGLFPGDTKPQDILSENPKLAFETAFGPDSNRNRILAKTFEPGETSADTYAFTLPGELTLTAGQTYWWGIESKTVDGQVHRKAAQFRVAPVEATSTPYASVTLITHGFQVPYANSGGAENVVKDFFELGALIAKQGGGHAFYYVPATGKWLPVEPGVTFSQTLGKPLVLISDWTKEAAISDSGFAEAAADAIFASLAQLNANLGGDLFASPMHLIGFSRGTPVTSEIAQRLNTYFPTGAAGGVKELHMTTLDPHDFEQASLDVPLDKILNVVEALVSLVPGVGPALGKVVAAANKLAEYTGNEHVLYADFKDPDVQTWAGVTFHDNYFQNVADPTGNPATPNGRPVATADINLSLNGRAGFTEDDLALGTIDYLIGSLNLNFGLGSPHFRVKSWYAGTLDLTTREFPSEDAATWAPDRIWRKITDRTFQPEPSFPGLAGLLADYDDVGVPWYRARESEDGSFPWVTGVTPTEAFSESDVAPWEGIGAGWFYSELGGGKAFRPASDADRVPIDTDNTEHGPWDGPVPTVFNGNFQASIRPVWSRFPIDPLGTFDSTWLEIPGWSFHGGNGEATQGASYGVRFRTDWLDQILDPLLAELPNASALDFLKSAASTIGKKVASQILTGDKSKILGEGGLVSVLPDLVGALQDIISAGGGIGNALGLIDFVLDKTKIKAAANAAATSVVTGTLTDAVKGLISFAQAYLLDYSFTLTPDTRVITHNRMFIPEEASLLTFDMSVAYGQPGAAIEVTMKPDTGAAISLGFIGASQSSGFAARTLTVPEAVKGAMATLTFTLVGGGPYTLPGTDLEIEAPLVGIDNVQFGGLSITDSSGRDADQILFFQDDLDPTPDRAVSAFGGTGNDGDGEPGETPLPDLPDDEPEITYGFGSNIQEFTVRNVSTTATAQAIVTVDPNWFLVYVDGDTETPFNNNQRGTVGAFSIAPGGLLTMRFKSDLNPLAVNQIGAEDFWLLEGKIKVQQLAGEFGPEVPIRTFKTTELTAWYLADIGDEDRDDGFIQVADTLQGAERTLRFRNDSRLQSVLDASAAGRFEVDGEGRDTKIVFNSPSVDAVPVEGELFFELDGTQIGGTMLVGRAVPVQQLNVPFTLLVNEVERLLAELEAVKFSFITPPPEFIDPAVVVVTNPDGTRSLPEYEKFIEVFRTDTAAKMAEFRLGIEDAILRAYSSFIGAGGLPQALVVNDVAEADTDFDVGFSKGSGSRTLLGSSSLDGDMRNYFGNRGLIDGTFSSPPDPGQPEGWYLKEGLTAASQRFRIDAILNKERENNFRVYLDALIRSAQGEGAITDAGGFGERVGKTIAHEFGHQLGLLDEYVGGRNPARNDAYAGFSRPGYMSNRFETSATPFQQQLQALALDLPTVSDALFGFADGAAPIVGVTNFVREQRSLVLLNYYNYYADTSPEEFDPAAPLLSFDPATEPDAEAATFPGAILGAATFGPAGAAPGGAPPADRWRASGGASVEGTRLTLVEDQSLQSGLARTLVVPEGAIRLAFDVVEFALDAPDAGPRDAFEVALLDPDSFAPIVGATSLTLSDAVFNVQSDGRYYTDDDVALLGVSGATFPLDLASPVTVTIDLAGIDAGRAVALYFDLLGFGALGSRVSVDNVRFELVDGPDNEAPVARNDAYAVPNGMPVEFDLRANDSDADGDALVATVVAGPSNGTLTQLPDGTFRYTPDAGFSGNDAFTYRVSDGIAFSDVASVNLAVSDENRPPVVNADPARSTRPGQSLTIVGAELLANDTDPDGDALAIASFVATTELGGSITSPAYGTFVYTPLAGVDGSDTFRYVVSDGAGGFADGALAIDVVNGVPVVNADPARSVRPGQSLTILVSELLANDTDPDGDPLAISGFTATTDAGGAITVAAPDAFTYTSLPGFIGADAFRYVVSDGAGGFTDGALTINVVNGAPIAADDTLTVEEDGTGRVRLVANDSDPDGDPLAIEILTGPAHGIFVAEEDGWYRYTPGPAYNGADTVTYRLSDGYADATATLVITVTPVNDAPRFISVPPTLLQLGEGTSGASNDTVFLAPGARGTTVQVDFLWTFREAGYNNELGVYRVDDLAGSVNGIAPGQAGYARTALGADRGEVVFASGLGACAASTLALEGGSYYAFYLVQNGTTARFLATNADNVLGRGLLTFFSLQAANPDGYDHLRLKRTVDGGVELAWEDLTNGGDKDFDDVVFRAGVRLAAPDATFRYDADAFDADGDALTFSLAEAPEGAEIDAATGLVSWLPEVPGVHRFVVRVADGQGGAAEQAFEVNVTRPDRVLHVRGTEGNDQIEVTEDDGLVRVRVNGHARAYTGITAVRVDALGGNDVVRLRGLTVDTLVEGGCGNDKLDASAVHVARVELRGGRGNDDLRGGRGDDRLLGGSGNDTVRGGAGDDWIDGGDGCDTLFGGAGDDVLLGGRGADSITGGDGDDVLGRDDCRDRLDGQRGCDRVVDELTFLADLGYRTLPAADAGPVIDWSRVAAGVEAVPAVRSSWTRDFVTGLGQRPEERNPNLGLRVDVPR